MRLILAATLMLMAAPALADVSSLKGEAGEAAAVVDAFHAALHRGDTKAAAVLLADDATVYEEGHAERSKAEYAAEHLRADAVFSQAMRSTIERRIGGGSGDVAWVASEGRTKGTYKGKAVHSLSTETMVLRRAGNSWRIVHIHWSSHAAPKGAKAID
jgi:ketosteroid isomerase-like protein